MRFAAIAMAAALLPGCYLSHERVGTPGPGLDAGAPDAGERDAGFDAGRPFMPPPGVCVPPRDQLVDRFPGDSQAQRDLDAVRAALFRACTIGEGCGELTLEVARDGRVSTIAEVGGGVTEDCAEMALRPLCLPGLTDAGPQAVSVCGI